MQHDKEQLEIISNQIKALFEHIDILTNEIEYRNMALDLLLAEFDCEDCFCDISKCYEAAEQQTGATCREIKRISIIERAKRDINLLNEIEES